MKLVIDASVAVKWVVAEPDSAIAAALIEHDIVAPSIWIVECANALWSIFRRGELSASEVEDRLDNLLSAPVVSLDSGGFIRSAMELSLELRHPVYDCVYLAVAKHEGIPLITADRRLQRAVSSSPRVSAIVRSLDAAGL